MTYQTLPGSVSDAKYLVFHKGGVTEFLVNQQIGGGTWVYLGTFEFDKGTNDYGMVVLSNESRQKGVVCADAVRFGGGMGSGNVCGAISGGIAALSYRFVKETGHKSPELMRYVREYVLSVQKEMGSINCRDLHIQYATAEEKCYLTIEQIVKILDQIYKAACYELNNDNIQKDAP